MPDLKNPGPKLWNLSRSCTLYAPWGLIPPTRAIDGTEKSASWLCRGMPVWPTAWAALSRGGFDCPTIVARRQSVLYRNLNVQPISLSDMPARVWQCPNKRPPENCLLFVLQSSIPSPRSISSEGSEQANVSNLAQAYTRSEALKSDSFSQSRFLYRTSSQRIWSPLADTFRSYEELQHPAWAWKQLFRLRSNAFWSAERLAQTGLIHVRLETIILCSASLRWISAAFSS